MCTYLCCVNITILMQPRSQRVGRVGVAYPRINLAYPSKIG